MRNDRTIPMSREMVEIVEEQLDAFKEKFGREAGPEDSLFFNPDCDTPTPLTPKYMDRMMAEALHRAGVILTCRLANRCSTHSSAKCGKGRRKAKIEAEVRRMRLKERNKGNARGRRDEMRQRPAEPGNPSAATDPLKSSKPRFCLSALRMLTLR